MKTYITTEQQRQFNQVCESLADEQDMSQYPHIVRVMQMNAITYETAYDVLDEIAAIGGHPGALADEVILREFIGDVTSSEYW